MCFAARTLQSQLPEPASPPHESLEPPLSHESLEPLSHESLESDELESQPDDPEASLESDAQLSDGDVS